MSGDIELENSAEFRRKIVRMENFRIVVVLATLVNIIAMDRNINKELITKCFPHAKMSDIDINYCIEKLHQNGLIDGCDVVQEKVRRGRTARNFWLNIPESERDHFAEDFTFSVYWKMGNWYDFTIPFNSVVGCSDMALQKPCTLPGYNKANKLVAIFPEARKPSDWKWYCLWEIIEDEEVFVRICDGNDEGKPCLKYSDGLFYEPERIFIPVSAQDIKPLSATYCFFSATQEIVTDFMSGGASSYRIQEDVSSTISEGCHEVDAGLVRVTEVAKTQKHIALQGVICFLARFPGFSSNWTQSGLCISVGNEVIDSEAIYFHVAVGAMACLIMFIAGFCCKLYVIKKMEKSLPSTTLVIARTACIENNTAQGTSLLTKDSSSEIYFPIEIEKEFLYELSAGKVPDELDKSPYIKAKGNILRWSSGDIEDFQEKGIYCSKLDTNPYIKMKQEIN